MSDDPIERACAVLRKNSQERYPKNAALSSAVNHACHVLRTLVKKRVSLSHAMTALEGLSEDCQREIDYQCKVLGQSNESESKESSYNIIQQILIHWFIQYIRMRDGLVMLVSGECRHPADQKMAKNEKEFASNLTKKSGRKDGTRVYRESGCYSGYGWDEFYDEEVGVRACMIEALGGTASSSAERRVDRLLTGYGCTFEIQMSEHEQKFKSLEKKLDILKDNFVTTNNRFLKRASIGILSLRAVDKFEKLLLQKQGRRIFAIDRMADNFVIRDKGGVIPSVAKLKDWQRAIKLPDSLTNSLIGRLIDDDSSPKQINVTSRKKSRSRVIIDDDDVDDDNNVASKVGTTTSVPTNQPIVKQSQISTKGLKVKMAPTLDRLSTSPLNQNISVSTIKEGLGVNSSALQASMEQAQAEISMGTTLSKTDYNSSEIQDDIAHYKEEIKRFKKDLKTAFDEDEMWNIKEGLREVSMKLGNLLLTMSSEIRFDSTSNEYSNSDYYINEAIKSFQYACIVIDSLEDSYLRSEENDITLKKTLLLLKSRAKLNAGISFVELLENMCVCPAKSNRSQIKVHDDAEMQLSHAEAAATSLKTEMSFSNLDYNSGVLSDDQVSDIIFFIQVSTVLVSIFRARIKLHWLRRNWRVAIAQFKEIRQLEQKHPFSGESYHLRILSISNSYMDDIHKEALEYLVEKYITSMILVTLATSSVGKEASIVDDENIFAEATCLGYDIALQTRSDIQYALEKHKGYDPNIDLESVSSFFRENEILEQSDLESARSGFVKWWDKRNQSLKSSNTPLHFPKDYSIYPRNLYIQDTFGFPTIHPKVNQANFVSSKGTRSAPRSRKSLTLMKTTSDSGRDKRVRYRKWGDERLEHQVGYPAGPPPRPFGRSSATSVQAQD